MRVNGKTIKLTNDENLSDFLKKNDYEISRIAVEYNGNVISRNNFSNIIMKDTDTLEIVCFVGGG